MLKELKKIYPSLIKSDETDPDPHTNYKWFHTTSHEIVGIDEQDLKDNDLDLLSLLLTPYQDAHPPITKKEKEWFKLLFSQDSPNNLNNEHYQFIFFSLSEAIEDPTDFREAIKGMYLQTPPIIFTDQQSGIIIQEGVLDDEEAISFYEMVEVFTSDFFIDVKFFIGPTFNDLNKAQRYYYWMRDNFNKLQNMSTKPVITYVSAVPYLLTHLHDSSDRQFLVEAILKDTLEDEELLRTIQLFIESNSNISLTAKEMFMHRNSLQYRIDKFIERTEIDVKQFEGALSVYLILIMKHQLD
ncbi:PucR C-terminal helix-turn-helix domain-containing protein [Pelagirhabdus alkalitolerans]|uniref:PucR C-terminal helix-turn-helix domain-containing protein n=1 Tax=Pelagirhabdus alkalitolerans TaxID=1612202 RepID=A0A1G6N415_9BACI|nr:helix-turn-helix domain-containing protein [Pelagirhabdus alkalitolerans]SDC62570.1 PucR C-terminal helix-turn-helix domain-containing protein [Pelagirhabdus alkalitolerans]